MKRKSGDEFNRDSNKDRHVWTKRKLGSKGTRCFLRLPFTSLYIVWRGRYVSNPFADNKSLAFSALPYDTLKTYHCLVSDWAFLTDTPVCELLASGMAVAVRPKHWGLLPRLMSTSGVVFIIVRWMMPEDSVQLNIYLSRSAGFPPLSPSRTVHATFTAHGSCNSVNYFSF